MFTACRTGKYAGDKLALLGLLIISLLVARLVVGIRSAIRLSPPIELNYSGLSVSMPAGNGWHCENRWMYQEDGFVVGSVFVAGAGAARPYAHCHYLLAAEEQTLQERFSRQAALVAGQLLDTGRLAAGAMTIDWARIGGGEPARDVVEMFFGTCRLPGGRRLDIEVFEPTEEKGIAQRVFGEIVKSIGFADNGLLQAGAEVVAAVRGAGLDSILASSPPFDREPVILFVLTDARGRAIGFTMDALVAGKADVQPSIRAASYYYIRGRIPDEQVGLFRSDNNFKQFVWRVENASQARSQGIEMVGDSGAMVVREFKANPKERRCALSGAAVPDILFELVARKMLDSQHQVVVIDVIRPDGTVVPVHVQRIEPNEPRAGKGDYSYALRAELLDGRGYWQQIYFDAAKQPVKMLLGQDGTYTLGRVGVEEIVKIFPERAYLVSDYGRLLDREGL